MGVLNATSVAEIRLPVADHELRYLNNNGIDATVTLSAKVAGQPVSWQGKIVRSEGVVDNKSRMTYLVAQVRAPYQDQAQPLRFGTYLTAQIQGISVANAMRIPRHLVHDGKVALLDHNQQLTFKPISVIREVDGYAIATEGLTDGQQLITSALEYPSEGMQLRLDSSPVIAPDTQLALKEE